MRNELFKYRKRKSRSIDGSVAGAPYVRYSRSRRPVSGLPYGSRGPGYHHDLYMWGSPREYHPNLNAPAVQETEYEPYEPLDLHHIQRAGNPRLPHDVNDVGQDMPFPSCIPEDDLTRTEQFLIAMGARNEIEEAILEGPRVNINEENLSGSASTEPQLPVEFRSIDQLPCLEDLKDAFLALVDVLPDDHPDLMNVRMAMRKVRDHHILLSDIEDLKRGGDPLDCDPFQEAKLFFDQQMTLLEKSFDEPMEAGAQDLFESDGFEPELMPDGILADDPFMEAQILEEIIREEGLFEAPAAEFLGEDMMPNEVMPVLGTPGLIPEPAGYDPGMITDEINQAIDQVSGQPMPEEMEPDPFAPQYDPYMAAQQMFDPQRQYMADPFMMSGMGPMPGPMPGP